MEPPVPASLRQQGQIVLNCAPIIRLADKAESDRSYASYFEAQLYSEAFYAGCVAFARTEGPGPQSPKHELVNRPP